MSAIHVLAYLLVPAIALSLAWGIRGQTGHEWGAAFCGAVVGLALALVSKDRNKVKKAFTLAAVGAFAFAWGGMMSYGKVAGLATNAQATNGEIALSLAQLFLLGAIWGGLGGGAIGVVCSRRNYGAAIPVLILLACWLGGRIIYELFINRLHFDIGHRHQDWAFVFGAWIALLLVCCRDRTVLTMSLLSGAGIGLGFVIGPMLTRISGYPFSGRLPLSLDWWKVAEQTIGFWGGLGLGLALWLLERRGHQAYLPERVHPLRPFLAQAFALWFIPAWNANNVFEYLSKEQKLIPTGAWTLFLAGAGAVLLAATAIWLCRLCAGACCGWRLDETAAAAIGFLWLVWAGVFIAGLKTEWPFTGDEFIITRIHSTQLVFTLMAVLLTGYLVLRAPDSEARQTG